MATLQQHKNSCFFLSFMIFHPTPLIHPSFIQNMIVALRSLKYDHLLLFNSRPNGRKIFFESVGTTRLTMGSRRYLLGCIDCKIKQWRFEINFCFSFRCATIFGSFIFRRQSSREGAHEVLNSLCISKYVSKAKRTTLFV